jgi:hypothetical protein
LIKQRTAVPSFGREPSHHRESTAAPSRRRRATPRLKSARVSPLRGLPNGSILRRCRIWSRHPRSGMAVFCRRRRQSWSFLDSGRPNSPPFL